MPRTAVELHRQQRRAKKIIKSIALFVMVGPVALGLIAFLIFYLGSGSGWSLLGLPFILLASLVSLGLPLLVPVIFVVGAWALIRSYYRKPPPPVDGPATALMAPQDAAASPLAAELGMLETLRTELAAQARRRTRLAVPLGLATALLLYFFMTRGSGNASSDHPVVLFVIMMVIGGGGPWIWAVAGPGARYALAFKTELLPRLLAAYGELKHTIGISPDIGRAVALGFLPGHDRLDVDDAFTGSYRQRPIRITELNAIRRGHKSESSVFHGLLVEIAVSTPFRGVTILRDREGAAPSGGLQRLRLEDPRFEEIYATYATDQIEGRAVLTPAVMERLLVMADGRSFLPPLFMLEGATMIFALPVLTHGSLFEPPGLETHVAAQQLASLEADLAIVFSLADAMIDMHVAVRAPQDAFAEPVVRTPTP